MRIGKVGAPWRRDWPRADASSGAGTLTRRSCVGWSRHWKDSRFVFGLGPATRIYVALGAPDLRKGFDGLYGIVRDRLGLEVRSGHLFLFANSRRNRLKILYWDGSGLWIC